MMSLSALQGVDANSNKNQDDGSVVSELTQETKSLASPVAQAKASVEGVSDALVAPPVSDETNGAEAAQYSGSSASASPVVVEDDDEEEEVDPQDDPLLSPKKSLANSAQPLESPISSLQDAVKVETGVVMARNNSVSSMYGLRNPTTPILESSEESTADNDDDPNDASVVSDIDDGYGTEDESVTSARSMQRRQSVQEKQQQQQQQQRVASAGSAAGPPAEVEDGGYGTEDESVESVRSMQRQQSLQHRRRMSAEYPSASAVVGSGGGTSASSMLRRRSAGYEPTKYEGGVGSWHRRAAGGFLGGGADSVHSRSSHTHDGIPVPPGGGSSHSRSHETQPPEEAAATQQSPIMMGPAHERPKRRAGRRRYQDDAPGERGVERVTSGDSTVLAGMSNRVDNEENEEEDHEEEEEHVAQSPPRPPGLLRMSTTDSTDLPAMHGGPQRRTRRRDDEQDRQPDDGPATRGVVRMSTADSTDLAAMQRGPKRRGRRRNEQEPAEAAEDLEKNQNHTAQYTPPDRAAGPPQRGVMRTSTSDSTDLAGMRGGPKRRARRRNEPPPTAQTNENPQPAAAAPAPPTRGVVRTSTNDSTDLAPMRGGLVRRARRRNEPPPVVGGMPEESGKPAPLPQQRAVSAPPQRGVVRTSTNDSTDLAPMRGGLKRRARRRNDPPPVIDGTDQAEEDEPSETIHEPEDEIQEVPVARQREVTVPPTKRGVVRTSTTDSTDLAPMRGGLKRRARRRNEPPPVIVGTGDQEEDEPSETIHEPDEEIQEVAVPPARGLVRTSTTDSTDLAPMRGGPKRRARRRNEPPPVIVGTGDQEEDEPSETIHENEEEIQEVAPHRGVVRTSTTDSTDLAPMRGGLKRRARRRNEPPPAIVGGTGDEEDEPSETIHEPEEETKEMAVPMPQRGVVRTSTNDSTDLAPMRGGLRRRARRRNEPPPVVGPSSTLPDDDEEEEPSETVHEAEEEIQEAGAPAPPRRGVVRTSTTDSTDLAPMRGGLQRRARRRNEPPPAVVGKEYADVVANDGKESSVAGHETQAVEESTAAAPPPRRGVVRTSTTDSTDLAPMRGGLQRRARRRNDPPPQTPHGDAEPSEHSESVQEQETAAAAAPQRGVVRTSTTDSTDLAPMRGGLRRRARRRNEPAPVIVPDQNEISAADRNQTRPPPERGVVRTSTTDSADLAPMRGGMQRRARRRHEPPPVMVIGGSEANQGAGEITKEGGEATETNDGSEEDELSDTINDPEETLDEYSDSDYSDVSDTINNPNDEEDMEDLSDTMYEQDDDDEEDDDTEEEEEEEEEEEDDDDHQEELSAQPQHAEGNHPALAGRGVVRASTTDSADLAPMRGGLRRRARRRGDPVPLVATEEFEHGNINPVGASGERGTLAEQKQFQERSASAPPERGVVRTSTNDSTDLAPMRGGLRRRARRRGEPAPILPSTQPPTEIGARDEMVQSKANPAPPVRGVVRSSTNDSTDLAPMRGGLQRRARRRNEPAPIVDVPQPQNAAQPPERGVVRTSTSDSTDLAAMRGGPRRRGRRRGPVETEPRGQQESAPPQPPMRRKSIAGDQHLPTLSGVDGGPPAPPAGIPRRASTGHMPAASPANRNEYKSAGTEEEPQRGVPRTFTADSPGRAHRDEGGESGNAGGSPPRGGVARTYTADSVDLKQQADAGGGSGLPRKQRDNYGREIRRGKRRDRQPDPVDVPGHKQASAPTDGPLHSGKLRRRASTGGLKPGPGVVAEDEEYDPVESGVGKMQVVATRRASTGHSSNEEVTNQYQFTTYPTAAAQTSATKGKGILLVTSSENVGQPDLEESEEEEETEVEEISLSESLDTFGSRSSQNEEDGEGAEGLVYHDCDGPQPQNVTRELDSSTATLMMSNKSPIRQTKAKLAAERMSGPQGVAEAEEMVESEDESTIHGYSEKEIFVESESETFSMNSAKNTGRRGSIQSSLNNDPLAASLLGPDAALSPVKRGIINSEENDLDRDSLLEMDYAAADAAIKSLEKPTESTTEDSTEYGAPGRSIGADQTPPNVLVSSKRSGSKREKESWGRAAPFTTPHVALTKAALAKSEQAAGIPLEMAMNKVSMHGNWGDLRIQSSCESSEEEERHHAENLYQDSETLQEFDRYKQRPRRNESIRGAFIDMEEVLTGKKGDKAQIPEFIPAANCTNASDFVVRCFVARLRNGITVVKHNRSRWSKSSSRQLFLMSDLKTLSWKPAEGEEDKGKRPELDLTKCKEVRHAWSRDPDTRKLCGTSILRKKVRVENEASRSFALIFSKRTLDMTAITPDSCKVLIEGFSALCFRLQMEKLQDPNDDPGTADNHDTASRSAFASDDDDDWASTVYGETTASLTQSAAYSGNGQQPSWGL